MAMVNGPDGGAVTVNGYGDGEARLVNGHLPIHGRAVLENGVVHGDMANGHDTEESDKSEEHEVNGHVADNEDNGDNENEDHSEQDDDSGADCDPNIADVLIVAMPMENVPDDSEGSGDASDELDVASGDTSDDSVTPVRRAILFTGGAGYVGSHTIMHLIERGDHDDYDLVVVDNLFNAYRAEGELKPEALKIIEEMTRKEIHFYQVDLRDRDELNAVFERHNIEYVLHFAALKAVGESMVRPLDYYEANIMATTTLIRVMQAHDVCKIVYSSSCTVYGEPDYLPIDEEHPTGKKLTSPYGKTKYVCEEIMRDVCTSNKKWSVVSLRYFNPVGAHKSGRIGEDPNGIPNNLMPYVSQVAVGRLNQLLVFGDDYDTIDGTGVRDFIHVEDLADGHVCALNYFSKPTFDGGFQAINLGTGKGYSVLQLVGMFERVCGRKIPHTVVGRREGDIVANYADASLAKKLLGWYSVRTLYTMCDDTWRWQSAHPHGFRRDDEVDDE